MTNRLILTLGFCSLLISIAYYFFPDFRRNALPLFSSADLRWIALALMATVLHFLSEVVRWWLYLRKDVVGEPALLRKLLSIFSLTAFLTYLLPAKLGFPLRLYLLNSQLRITLTQTSVLLVVDGFLSYGTWLIATILLYLALPSFPFSGQVLPYAIGVLGLAFVAITFVVRSRGAALRNLRAQVESIEFCTLLTAEFVLIVDIGGYVLRHAAILWALGMYLSPIQIAFATVLSITVGFLSMLPMGIGAYDVTLILLLSQYGVPEEVAVVVPLINRVGNLLVAVLLGLPASYVTGMSLITLRERLKTTAVS